MDIKDLKVFHTIAKEESIAKASRILYMTPQRWDAVSLHVINPACSSQKAEDVF